MDTTYPKPETLIGVALAPLDWTRSVGLVLGFSLLTAASAQLVIPVGPIPITGQTFAVLLTGALLGSRLGAITLIVYLIEGASGLLFFRGFSHEPHSVALARTLLAWGAAGNASSAGFPQPSAARTAR